MEFNARLRELRQETGLEQKEFAKKIKMSYTTYNHYETGRSEPDYDTVKMLADFFGVSIDYLLGKTDVKKSLNSEHEAINLFVKQYQDYFPLIMKMKENEISITFIEGIVDQMIKENQNKKHP